MSYLFKLRGVITVDKAAASEETVIETALEAGAEDVVTESDTYEILTPPNQLDGVREALGAKGIATQSAELTKTSSQMVPLEESAVGSVLRLIEAIEDHDDVQKVYSNFSVTDEVLARLMR